MKYLCWDNENETRDDAKEFDACDEDEAAEQLAERDHNKDPFESIDVNVESPDGTVKVIRVLVGWAPTFTAVRILTVVSGETKS